VDKLEASVFEELDQHDLATIAKERDEILIKLLRDKQKAKNII
jgi:hypothetical protein